MIPRQRSEIGTRAGQGSGKIGRGFTLIELTIVVAIIGLLAAIAIPAFIRFSCKAKQSEAKSVLKQILVAQETYRGEHDTYLQGTSFELQFIGVIIVGPNQRYVYSVPTASTNTFTAMAVGQGDQTGDHWETDQTNHLRVVSDLCASL